MSDRKTPMAVWGEESVPFDAATVPLRYAVTSASAPDAVMGGMTSLEVDWWAV
jgi:hypothetical protein